MFVQSHCILRVLTIFQHVSMAPSLPARADSRVLLLLRLAGLRNSRCRQVAWYTREAIVRECLGRVSWRCEEHCKCLLHVSSCSKCLCMCSLMLSACAIYHAHSLQISAETSCLLSQCNECSLTRLITKKCRHSGPFELLSSFNQIVCLCYVHHCNWMSACSICRLHCPCSASLHWKGVYILANLTKHCIWCTEKMGHTLPQQGIVLAPSLLLPVAIKVI